MTRNSNQPRVPPHDLDAERALLGAALMNPDAAQVLVGVPAHAFWRPTHGHIAAAIAAVHRRGDPVDLVTVPAELRAAGLLGDGGVDPADLISIQSSTPSTTNAGTYAAIVLGHAATRRVIRVAESLLEGGYGGADSAQLLEQARHDLDTAVDTTTSRLAWADVATILANGAAPITDPDLLLRTDGKPLLYLGRVHMLQGEPGSAKSFLALHAAAQTIDLGGTVLYIDYEDTDAGLLGRLLALKVGAEDITQRFRLVRCHGPLGPVEIADIDQAVKNARPDLVIIDGVAEALAGDGLDENVAADVVGWLNRLPKHIVATTGAAVVLLDHVSKSKEDRGRWARGSGAKLGAVDGAAYEMRVIDPFSRDTPGKVQLVVAKDRPGAIGANGHTAGYVHIVPSAHGAVVDMRVEPPTADEVAGLPTAVMTAVSGWLAANGATTKKDLEAGLRQFRQQTVFGAVGSLLRRGHVREVRLDLGPATRGGTAYELVRPYPDPPTQPDLEEF